MFSHVFISVGGFDRAYAFCAAVMESLGIVHHFCGPDKSWAGCHAPVTNAAV